MVVSLDSTRERTRLAPNAFALERNKRPLFRDIGVRYREADRRHSKSYMRMLRPRGERPLSCVFIRYWVSRLPERSLIRRREKTCMEKRKSPRRPHGFPTGSMELASQRCSHGGASIFCASATLVLCVRGFSVVCKSESSRRSNASATTLLPREIYLWSRDER